MKLFKKIRLVALDLDGVRINDTYSPVIKNFIEKKGEIYTREIERLIWGASHIAAGHNIANFHGPTSKRLKDFLRKEKNILSIIPSN